MEHLPNHPNLLHILNTLLEAFPIPQPPYCLIGALALSAWGKSRATEDIDLLMLFEPQWIEQLQTQLAPHGFQRDHQWMESNPLLKGQMVRFRHKNYPLDLLMPCDAHDRETLHRRKNMVLGKTSLWICAPEDLIVLKLKAGRPRDIDDILSVLYYQGSSMDLNYLWGWAERLGLQSELDYVLTSMDSPP